MTWEKIIIVIILEMRKLKTQELSIWTHDHSSKRPEMGVSPSKLHT